MSDKVTYCIELISNDPDLNALQVACCAMEMSSERMRKATLQYLWDRFVIHGEKLENGKTGGT